MHTALERAADLRRLRETEHQLSLALQQGRSVSLATGMLMERARLNRQRAFETLRKAARSRRRRLPEFAEELVVALEQLNAVDAVTAGAAVSED